MWFSLNIVYKIFLPTFTHFWNQCESTFITPMQFKQLLFIQYNEKVMLALQFSNFAAYQLSLSSYMDFLLL